MEKLKNENGMSTVEIVFIIAILISLALIFGSSIKTFAKKSIEKITDDKLFETVDPNYIGLNDEIDLLLKTDNYIL